MDEENPDRKYRKMLLDPQLVEIGMSQITHPQYDYINLLTLKKRKQPPILKQKNNRNDVVLSSLNAKSPTKERMNMSIGDTLDPDASTINRTRTPSKAPTAYHTKTPTKEDYTALDINFD